MKPNVPRKTTQTTQSKVENRRLKDTPEAAETPHRRRPSKLTDIARAGTFTLSWEASFFHSTLPADPTLRIRVLHLGGCSPWGKCSLRAKVIKPETPRHRQSPQKASRGSVCGGEAPSRAPGPLAGCSPGPRVASAPHGLPTRRGRAPLSLRHSCTSSPSQRPTWRNGHLAFAGGHCRQAGPGFSSQLREPCPPTPPPPAPASMLPSSPSRSQAVPAQTPAGPPLPRPVLSFLGS